MGNKSDLENQRVVAAEMGEKFASDHLLEFFECSVVSFFACCA